MMLLFFLLASIVAIASQQNGYDTQLEIRAKGTFVAYLVDQQNNQTQKQLLNSTMWDKVELPNICNPDKHPSITSATKLTAMLHSCLEIQYCWCQAAGHHIIQFMDMPFLDVQQFQQFYRCVLVGQQQQYFQKKESEIDQLANDGQELLYTVVFGDRDRNDIGWLELWVYLCNDGQQPEEYLYKEKDYEQIRKSIVKQTYQKQQLSQMRYHDRTLQEIRDLFRSQSNRKMKSSRDNGDEVQYRWVMDQLFIGMAGESRKVVVGLENQRQRYRKGQ